MPLSKVISSPSVRQPKPQVQKLKIWYIPDRLEETMHSDVNLYNHTSHVDGKIKTEMWVIGFCLCCQQHSGGLRIQQWSVG